MSIGTHELGVFEIGTAPSPFIPTASPPPPAPAPEPAPEPERNYVFRPMTAQLVTPLPTPPSRRNPIDFNNRADTWNDALVILTDQINRATPGDSAAGLAQYLGSVGDGKGTKLVRFKAAPASSVERLLDDVCNDEYHVSNWGVDTTGATDCTVKLQKALDELPAGAQLRVTGKLNFTSVNWTPYRNKLVGDAVLYGTLNITSSGVSGQNAFFEINGLTWNPATENNTVDCIVLKNLAYGKVKACNFRGVNKCISVPNNTAQTAFQDVNRIELEGNQFEFVNHFIYTAYSGDAAKYGTGDWTLRGNCGMALITTVRAQKMDGLTATSNTFFFQLATTAKRQHFLLTDSPYVTIKNNKLFEAGADSINLTDCTFPAIGGNTHAYPGQVIDGAAVSIAYTSLPALNAGSIQGEIILRPSTGGIQLGANCRNMLVSNNVIVQPGSNDHAQVGPTLSSLGIVEASSTVDLFVTGNMVIGGTYSLVDGTRNKAKNNYYESIVGNVGTWFDRMVSFTAGGLTNPSIDAVDEIVYSQSVTIVGLTNTVTGCGWKEIMLRFTVGTCVLTNSASLVLKGGVNASPPANSIMRFRVAEGGAAYEVSRSF